MLLPFNLNEELKFFIFVNKNLKLNIPHLDETFFRIHVRLEDRQQNDSLENILLGMEASHMLPVQTGFR